jgi:hypothetical protein
MYMGRQAAVGRLRNHDVKLLWMAAARRFIEGAARVEGACRLHRDHSLAPTALSMTAVGSRHCHCEVKRRAAMACYTLKGGKCLLCPSSYPSLCPALNASLRFQFVCLQRTLLPQLFTSTFNALRHHVLHPLHYLDQTTHHLPTLTISPSRQKHLSLFRQNRAKGPRIE